MAGCGLTNLGTCLVEKFFEFLLEVMNSPIRPFVNLNLDLLSEPINLSLFFGLWVIIIYLLSSLYALLLLGTGFNFMISGYDSEKREKAKTWLRNIVIMIVLVQASFFIYELAIDLSSILTSATLSLIDPSFFLVDSSDSITNMGLAITSNIGYLIVLFFTAMVLTIRYTFVSIGAVLFPVAIFLYFFPPLQQYGSLLLNFLGTAIFITFFDAIILIGFSKLLNVGIFGSMKIMVLISAFALISFLMLGVMLFSIIKAGFNIYIGSKGLGKK